MHAKTECGADNRTYFGETPIIGGLLMDDVRPFSYTLTLSRGEGVDVVRTYVLEPGAVYWSAGPVQGPVHSPGTRADQETLDQLMSAVGASGLPNEVKTLAQELIITTGG